MIGQKTGKESVVLEAASRRLEKASKRQDAASTVCERKDWGIPRFPSANCLLISVFILFQPFAFPIRAKRSNCLLRCLSGG